MTNLEKLIDTLGGLTVVQRPQDISAEDLRMVACPFEAVEDPDALEIDGCPSVTQCADCKRAWLAKEAE